MTYLLVGACNNLVELSVSWPHGPHTYFLRPPDLAQGLARLKHPLKKWVVDVRNFVYIGWNFHDIQGGFDDFFASDPLDCSEFSTGHAMSFPSFGAGTRLPKQPTYDGISMLGDLLSLRLFEISVYVLGPFNNVHDLTGMLPDDLESLVLLSPKQYGQPDIDDPIGGTLALIPSRMRSLNSLNGHLMEAWRRASPQRAILGEEMKEGLR